MKCLHEIFRILTFLNQYLSQGFYTINSKSNFNQIRQRSSTPKKSSISKRIFNSRNQVCNQSTIYAGIYSHKLISKEINQKVLRLVDIFFTAQKWTYLDPFWRNIMYFKRFLVQDIILSSFILSNMCHAQNFFVVIQ